jgi:hypothetical protein
LRPGPALRRRPHAQSQRLRAALDRTR